MSKQPTILTTESTSMVGPILPQERIEVLDILRGFAILGILFVNMAFFSSPFYLLVTDVKLWTGGADRLAVWLIRFFAEGKFYSLFSFLFGLGFVLQMRRAESRGARFAPFYRRRLFVLLLIGLAHAFLLWPGDILAVYAVIGFLLLLFRARSQKTVVVWAIISLLILIVITAVGVGFIELSRSIPEAAAQIDKAFAETVARYESLIEQSLRVYSQGSFREIMAQRAQDTGFMYLILVFWGPNILAMFLIGLYVGRRKLLQNVTAHLPLIRKVMWWGLGLGLVCNLIFVVARESSNPVVPSLTTLVYTVFFAIGAPALCFFYVSAIILLVQREVWRKRLAPLAAVGRMALSNYLFQSLICTTIFYSYGLGLYGKVGPAVGMVLTVVIFIIQVALSGWWLRRFKFGPFEWFWRSLTYGKRQAMRV